MVFIEVQVCPGDTVTAVPRFEVFVLFCGRLDSCSCYSVAGNRRGGIGAVCV